MQDRLKGLFVQGPYEAFFVLFCFFLNYVLPSESYKLPCWTLVYLRNPAAYFELVHS